METETRERSIRALYFLKRRRLQSKPRLNEEPVLARCKEGEGRRVEARYHAMANKVVEKAKSEGASTILLEDLKNIRQRIKSSRETNGRLSRWSLGKLRFIIKHKARSNGLNVAYINPKGTSSLCPGCRVKLSPGGYRL